jgi:hypothetical protein
MWINHYSYGHKVSVPTYTAILLIMYLYAIELCVQFISYLAYVNIIGSETTQSM